MLVNEKVFSKNINNVDEQKMGVNENGDERKTISEIL